MAHEFARNRQDAAVNPAALALPNAGGGTVETASVDLNVVDPFIAELEFQLVTPALTVGQLPNGETMTYTLEDSADDITFVPVMVLTEATQTGAGGAGDAGDADGIRFGVPSTVSRYVHVDATSSGGANNCSASDMTLTVRF